MLKIRKFFVEETSFFKLTESTGGGQRLRRYRGMTLSFTLKISSVNVTKSAGNCGFGHIY